MNQRPDGLERRKDESYSLSGRSTLLDTDRGPDTTPPSSHAVTGYGFADRGPGLSLTGPYRQLVMGFVACWGKMKSNYCIFNRTNQTFLGLSVARASSPLQRLKAVFGKNTLNEGDGLWIVPSQGAHSIGALAPIDLVYLDADCKVIHVIEHLMPLRTRPLRSDCASVLELPPHTIYSSQTRLGDHLLICLPDEFEAANKPGSSKAVTA